MLVHPNSIVIEDHKIYTSLENHYVNQMIRNAEWDKKDEEHYISVYEYWEKNHCIGYIFYEIKMKKVKEWIDFDLVEYSYFL